MEPPAAAGRACGRWTDGGVAEVGRGEAANQE